MMPSTLPFKLSYLAILTPDVINHVFYLHRHFLSRTALPISANEVTHPRAYKSEKSPFFKARLV